MSDVQRDAAGDPSQTRHEAHLPADDTWAVEPSAGQGSNGMRSPDGSREDSSPSPAAADVGAEGTVAVASDEDQRQIATLNGNGMRADTASGQDRTSLGSDAATLSEQATHSVGNGYDTPGKPQGSGATTLRGRQRTRRPNATPVRDTTTAGWSGSTLALSDSSTSSAPLAREDSIPDRDEQPASLQANYAVANTPPASNEEDGVVGGISAKTALSSPPSTANDIVDEPSSAEHEMASDAMLDAAQASAVASVDALSEGASTDAPASAVDGSPETGPDAVDVPYTQPDDYPRLSVAQLEQQAPTADVDGAGREPAATEDSRTTSESDVPSERSNPPINFPPLQAESPASQPEDTEPIESTRASNGVVTAQPSVADVSYTPPVNYPPLQLAPPAAQPALEEPVDQGPLAVEPPPPAQPPSQGVASFPPAPPPPPGDDLEEEGGTMTIIEHLEELRRRLIWCIAAIAVGSFAGWFAAPFVIEQLSRPLKAIPFISLTVFGPFVLQIKMAFILGTCFAMPMLLYQVWGFVMPGLTRQERRYAKPFVFLGSLLFLAGAATGFFIYPLGIAFALNFFPNLHLSPYIEADKYITFIGIIMVLFGITFELPVFLVFLSALGVISSRALAQRRKIAFVVIFVVAMVITPGADLVSPVILGVILCVLYESSIWLSKAIGK